MTSQQLELIARRGLALPEPTLTRLRTVGIWCEANLTVQRRDQDWLIRGQESGGAVNDIGRHVSFCKEDGSALSWLHPVKNFMPNGLHAILLAKGPIVRLDMYRFETSYDLLITTHTLVNEEGKPKPTLETKLIFFHRFGVLDRELWGKDKMFRGAVAPQFFMQRERSKSPARISTGRVQDDRSRDLHEMQAPAFAGTTIIRSVGRRSREREGLGGSGVIAPNDSNVPTRLITLGVALVALGLGCQLLDRGCFSDSRSDHRCNPAVSLIC